MTSLIIAWAVNGTIVVLGVWAIHVYYTRKWERSFRAMMDEFDRERAKMVAAAAEARRRDAESARSLATVAHDD